MLNWSGKSGYSCLPALIGKAFNFLPLIMSSIVLSWMAFIVLGKILQYLICWEPYSERKLNFVQWRIFFIQWDYHMIFILNSIYVGSSYTGLHTLNHSFIPETNFTWLCFYNFPNMLMKFDFQVLLRIFESMLIRDNFFSCMYLFACNLRVMLACYMSLKEFLPLWCSRGVWGLVFLLK
jgi:hypothetical protein